VPPFSKTAQQLTLQTIVWIGWRLLVTIISRGLWHSRSTDMNLCSFYLWGVLKDTVYGNYPYFEDVLTEKIQNVGFSVSPEEI